MFGAALSYGRAVIGPKRLSELGISGEMTRAHLGGP